MKPIKILILLFAACAGFIYYQRYHAVMNVAKNAEKSPPSSQTPNYVGGIGRIGQQSLKNSPPRYNSLSAYYDLIKAAAEGNQEDVIKLLRGGVDVNGRDREKHTALMYASWNGQNPICELLLTAGASTSLRDKNGFNSYDYAVSRGLIDTVKLLLHYDKTPDDKHYIEQAMIMQASYAGDVSYLPAGKKRLMSVNRVTPQDHSPLHLAANAGSITLAQILLERGADANLQNQQNQTPLHWAAWANQGPMVELLLKQGAKLSSKDIAGNTPLHLAAQNNSIESARILLAKGADKQALNKRGKSPKTIAQINGYKELTALFK
ncbi:MAG: ankyrin repeat domain-containing protein [Rickettsiales bacterium]|nr:ankyrin repeat domain-containing protein [Rickettsiales bacterium]